MSRKQGLGRGLGALIPDRPVTASATSDPAPSAADLVPTPGTVYAELPIDSVVPNPRQPRQVFDEEAMAELVHSIRSIGLLQPVVVRPAGDGYELVAGERRLRASREAGLSHIPAVIRSTDDDDLLRDALLENLHRSQLNALEEAAAYTQLMSDFGCTQEELARRIGRSRPQVTNTMRLLKLPPSVQRRVAAGVLSAGHARALLSLDDAQAMEDLANRVVAEGLSVRTVEEIVMVGGPQKRNRKPRGKRLIAESEEIAEYAATLSDALDTAVSIDMAGRRGRIMITVADADDLARVVGLIARAPAPPARG